MPGVVMKNEDSTDANLDDDGDPPETQEVLEELGEPVCVIILPSPGLHSQASPTLCL